MIGHTLGCSLNTHVPVNTVPDEEVVKPMVPSEGPTPQVVWNDRAKILEAMAELARRENK